MYISAIFLIHIQFDRIKHRKFNFFFFLFLSRLFLGFLSARDFLLTLTPYSFPLLPMRDVTSIFTLSSLSLVNSGTLPFFVCCFFFSSTFYEMNNSENKLLFLFKTLLLQLFILFYFFKGRLSIFFFFFFFFFFFLALKQSPQSCKKK